jgi:hypothetical protein
MPLDFETVAGEAIDAELCGVPLRVASFEGDCQLKAAH